jgi:hypothetical protein
MNIKNGNAMLNEKAVQIVKALFGEGPKTADKLGPAVARQYGVALEGFNVSSCQFAVHYFFEKIDVLQQFLRNVSECTKIGGYFIGTCYDGKVMFEMLKGKAKGDGVQIIDKANGSNVKIWDVKKQYKQEEFRDDSSCLGYKIDVFQESINKTFEEYLVNFDYLNRVIGLYGFKLITREEAAGLGLPEGSGLFSELFMLMEDEVKRNRVRGNDYGTALRMTAFEKKISFLNRYFVYKKFTNVNAVNVVIETDDEIEDRIEKRFEKPGETRDKKEKEKEKKTKDKDKAKEKREKKDKDGDKAKEKREKKDGDKKAKDNANALPKIRKLKKKILLSETDKESEEPKEIEPTEVKVISSEIPKNEEPPEKEPSEVKGEKAKKTKIPKVPGKKKSPKEKVVKEKKKVVKEKKKGVKEKKMQFIIEDDDEDNNKK